MDWLTGFCISIIQSAVIPVYPSPPKTISFFNLVLDLRFKYFIKNVKVNVRLYQYFQNPKFSHPLNRTGVTTLSNKSS